MKSKNHRYFPEKGFSMFSRVFSTLLIVLAFGKFGFSQGNIPIGTWRIHAPYRFANCVEYVVNRVYVGTSFGLFYYDLNTDQVSTITKIDGLHESNITSLKYDNARQQLIIGYNSGGIDFLKTNDITYFQDFKRSSIIGDKGIRQILLYGNSAYFSSGVGFLVVNLSKNEIKESYTGLSANGAQTAIVSTTIFKDTLYAITANGLIAGALNTNKNLMDFASWKKFSTGTIPGTNITQIASNSKWLFTVGNKGRLLAYANGTWKTALMLSTASGTIRKLASTNGRTILNFGEMSININDTLGLDTTRNWEIANARDIVFDPVDKNIVYYADQGNGLVINRYGSFKLKTPNGPQSPFAFRMRYANGKMYALAGSYFANYAPTGRNEPVGILDGANWTYQDIGVRDIISMAYNPFTSKTYYTSLASRGLAVVEPSGAINYINDVSPGSTLKDPVSPGAGYLRLTDVTVDTKGSVWLTHASEAALRPVLHSIDLKGNWKSYNIITSDAQSMAGKVIIDDFNNKWVKIGARDNNGLIVFNESKTVGSQTRVLTTEKGAGNLPDINVRCVEKDTNGEIWVGTAKGIGVYYNPSNMLASSGFDAGRPVYNSKALMDGQDVQDIKVDGGNRKWIATFEGAWLFSPDGSQLIHQFTAENSPLPSNQVLDIEINDETGEVFFVTSGGIASYREGSTVAVEKYETSTYKIFPNPVYANFSGTVGISGLTKSSAIRITDINGRLVYQTTSLGGTATWNLATFQGYRANPGVYMVFSINEDGSDQYVGKLAIIE